MATGTQLLSFEEFEALPNPAEGRLELLEGEVYLMPPPARRHSIVAVSLRNALMTYFLAQGMDLRRLLQDAGFLMRDQPRSWLVPDLSVTHENQPGEQYFTGAPLLAVEIISPGNGGAEIDRKRRIYLREGSQEVWVVYPETQTIYVHKAGSAIITRYEDHLVSDLFPGLEIDLRVLAC